MALWGNWQTRMTQNHLLQSVPDSNPGKAILELISMFKQKYCYIKTEEDWYPSFKFDGWHRIDGYKDSYLLRLFLLELKDGTYKVGVWGSDDYGLEREYPTDKLKDALEMFMLILEQEYMTRKFLMDHGFLHG